MQLCSVTAPARHTLWGTAACPSIGLKIFESFAPWPNTDAWFKFTLSQKKKSDKK